MQLYLHSGMMEAHGADNEERQKGIWTLESDQKCAIAAVSIGRILFSSMWTAFGPVIRK
ncbi:hypothetical protein PLACP1_15010 [Planifilum fimeticola]